MLTTGDIARRLKVPRSVVCYAIDRQDIKPTTRAGIVRLFSSDQWPEIVKAVNSVTTRTKSEGEVTA